MRRPTISSVSFDASTDTLVVSGADLSANTGAYDLADLTLTGQVIPNSGGTDSYTLTTASIVTAANAGAVTISLGGYDAVGVAGVLDQFGSAALDGTAYGASAASGFVSGAMAQSTSSVTATSGFKLSGGTVYQTVASDIASLNADIVAADGAMSGAFVIGVSGTIGITTELEAINLRTGVTLVISGGSAAVLDGEGDQRGLFVYAGSVTVEDLTIQSAVANGGDSDVGGAGAGLGGGLFVASGASVTLDAVTFSADSAVGGSTGVGGSDAGGGLGGLALGGGGGIGGTASGGTSGTIPGYGIVFGAADGNGGGGVGTADTEGGAGIGPIGIAGGFGGGGGFQGAGGFGGGGGGTFNGAPGGFGGGGGGSTVTGTGASGGFGGGRGGRGGGGGLGAGGDVFVMAGGSLTIDAGTLDAGAVAGGSAVAGGVSGGAFGGALFLQGNETVTLGSAGGSVVVDGSIADQTGSITGTVSSGAGALLIAAGAAVTLRGADSYTGGTTLGSGATMSLAQAGGAGTGGIVFGGGNALTLGFIPTAGGPVLGNALSGLAVGDSIELSSLAFVAGAAATDDGTTLTLEDGGQSYSFTLTAPFTDGFGVSADGGGTLITVACYAAGTRIAAPGAERAVEALVVGDEVLTASGAVRQVRWIGRRSYAGRFLRANPQVQPVRFHAGSLGGGLPRRDLLVSPDHAMFLDGMLIPARCLVNDITIVRDVACAQVEYVHLELDTHDVILAEGAASETFVDDDSRGLFHSTTELDGAALGRPAEYCAPRVEQGVALQVVRDRLRRVAAGGGGMAGSHGQAA